MLAEIQKTETGKKLSEAGEEALKQARAAAEQVRFIYLYTKYQMDNHFYQTTNNAHCNSFIVGGKVSRESWRHASI